MDKFSLGSVAVIDALGFREIWKRVPPRLVIEKLKKIRHDGMNLQGTALSGTLLRDPTMTLRVVAVSDTIFISALLKERHRVPRHVYRSMLSVSVVAATLMHQAIISDPPILYRGVLAAGEMLMDSHFLIGPAVDEAAQWYERADGPFYFLAPSALEISRRFAETYSDRLQPILMTPYPVPLNDGHKLKTLTYVHCNFDMSDAVWQETKSRVFDGFGTATGKPDIERKRNNTKIYWRHLERLRRSGKWRSQFGVFRPPQWSDLSSRERFQALKLGLKGIPGSPLDED